MRIDILPNNTPSALDAGSTRPESGQVPDEGTFSDVIGQMTVPGANKNQAVAEDSTPDVEKEDDHASERMAASLLPFVFVSAENPQCSMPGGTPMIPESSAVQTQAVPEGFEGASNRTATPAPASGATSDAGHPISIMPPADTVFSPASSTPSSASPAEVVGTRNPQAQMRGVSTPPATMQQADADLPPEAVRPLGSTVLEPENQVDVTLAVPSADLADSAQGSSVMPDGQTPSNDPVVRAAAIPQAVAAQISGATSDAGHPISTVPPADAVFSPAPSARYTAPASEELETGNRQAQRRGVSTPPLTLRQTDAGLSPEAARAMAPPPVEPLNPADVASVVLRASSAEAVPEETTAIPVFPPALPEKSSPEAPAQEISASEPHSPDGSPAISPTKSEAADVANLSAAYFGLDGAALSKAAGTRRNPDFPSVRGNAKETQAAGRHTQTLDQSGAVLNAPQPAADGGQVLSEFAFAAEVPKVKPIQENADQTNAAAKPAGAEKPKEAPAQRMVSTVDSVESGWTGTQNAQRMLFHTPSSPTGTPDAPVFAGFRPLPRVVSTTLASWQAGFRLPQQAGGSELKSILALLAPKQSAPAQATDFLAQLTGRIQMQLRDNQNILTIQLKPSSLGRMEIRAETSAAGVLATIFTESAGVKDYLERNLPLLQQNFQDQGLKIDRITVAVQEGPWPQQSSSGHQESRSSSSQHGDPGSRSRLSDHFGEPCEELALDQQTLLALRPHSTFHAIA